MSQFEEFILCERITFWVWKCYGLWASKDESPYYRAFRRIYHFFFTFIYLIAMFASAFYTDNLWSGIMFILLTEIAMVTKTIVTTNRFETIYRLHRLTITEHFTPRTEHEWQVHRKLFGTLSAALMVYLLGSLSACLSHFAYLFDGQYKLPYFGWFYWVPLGKTNPTNFYWVFSYQMFGMIGHCLLNVTGDMHIIYLLAAAGSQLDLLKLRFAKLPADCNRSQTYRKTFAENVQQYNRIHSFVRETEIAFSEPIFAQMCASGVTICASVLRLSSINILDQIGITIPIFIYLIAMLGQIFLPCYYGNEITLKSQQLTKALFASEWYKLAVVDRKELTRFMLRTNKPIQLKAGGFFYYNLEAFTATLNTAYSIYAVVNRKQRS
ncbi:odorant receptor 94b-like [Toxorhynchites rutilus septentrionalis]|uniref:odorant receptor 94b-like n=1 Tax=Toxorhynchites rutilus septentrionalis TaxID=329112 RepID=UPI00247B223B|nr:odorant receptor 94b-like [Toxorhynchites rutilus septentrionalis]